MLDALLAGEGEAVTRAVIEAAKGGDMTAAKLVLERLCPVRRDRPVVFALPAIETTADLTVATGALLRATADGELTPSEAGELSRLIETHIEAIRTVDLAERIGRIEEAQAR